MPPSVKDRRGVGSGSAYISVRNSPIERGMVLLKPAGEEGDLETGTCLTPSSIASSEGRGVMEAASMRVGNSLTSGTIVFKVSTRLITPAALRFFDEPSLTILTDCGLKKGCHVGGGLW